MKMIFAHSQYSLSHYSHSLSTLLHFTHKLADNNELVFPNIEEQRYREKDAVKLRFGNQTKPKLNLNGT